MDSSIAQSATAEPKTPVPQNRFTLFHQKVELDINFNQQITGRVEIEIHPEAKDFSEIYLNARQCTVTNITVNGVKDPIYYHVDPCRDTQLHFNSNAHQHHILAQKIDGARSSAPRPNLIIAVPRSVKIKEVNETDVHMQDGNTIRIPNSQADATSATEAARGLTDTSVSKFTPITVSMDFTSKHMRDVVQFVTGPRGSGRWPHAYTRGKPGGSTAGALFPCVDALYARGSWEISITTPQTVGDALLQCTSDELAGVNAEDKSGRMKRPAHENKEMVVVCSGELVSENVSKTDPTKKTVSFICLERLSARQVGFAVGPFERVDLNVFRSVEDQDKLGDNAVQMYGYCLPRRSEEVKNTCLPTTKAMDQMVQQYSAAPFQPYSMCFIEDLPYDVTIFAGLSMCSTRLLYPEEVADTAQEVTRKLVHAIASQWLGINVIPESPADTWVVVGIAHYMTDVFMRDLCGVNEYRARMKKLANDTFMQDRERPSIYDMGDILHLDPSAYEFLALKAPVVLFILDRRMAKTAGAAKMPGIISKILTRARTGDLDNNALSTDFFQKTTERANHNPIQDFMMQWVKGAGCPHFKITQRFNKKKLTIEMLFEQIQPSADRELDASSFVRDVREEWNEVYAGERQNVFTGPMTIRVHEADGTPYEHIVQIKDGSTQIDVPYKTKYKRLKRTRKQRKKAAAVKTVDEDDDEEDSQPVYYLGDILQTEEDLREWDLVDWSQEMENMMSMESFEWIRADADFEWIARIDLGLQGYMYASQLQQDRDIVSQLHAIQSIASYKADKTVSSILLRTLMDRRYFHGVRYLAAQGLVKHAHQVNEDTGVEVTVGKFHLQKAFDQLFCTFDSGSPIIRPNDFSDQQQYLAQIAIVDAVSEIRDKDGNAPHDVKVWMLDKLKFNDNSINDYSDARYVSTLMKGLVKTLIAKPSAIPDVDSMSLVQARAHAEQQQFEQICCEEIDRFRRMDEWTSSYQNAYSRTALECQSILANAGIIKFSPCHFLQYTRPGNYELLRLRAYRILIDRDIFRMPASLVKYVVHCLALDSSPMIRLELQKSFGRILGQHAIGDRRSEPIVIERAKPTAADEPSDVLVVDETANVDENAQSARAEEIARRSNVEAALRGLRKDLGDNEVLKKALWDAISSPDTLFDDLATLLDYCRILYEPKDSVPVTLIYPRYWRVEKSGKGKLHFTQTRKVRTKIKQQWKPPIPIGAPAAGQHPARAASISMPAPPGPRPGGPQQRQPSLKLNFRKPSLSNITPAPSMVVNGASNGSGGYFSQSVSTTNVVGTPLRMETPPPSMVVVGKKQKVKEKEASVEAEAEDEKPLSRRLILKIPSSRQGSISGAPP